MFAHLPVMVREVMEILDPKPGGVYIDATFGLGGHSAEILKQLSTNGKLIGIDRDEEALRLAGSRFDDERLILRKGNFSGLKDIMAETGIESVDGVLMDFGVSMMQFKDLNRGFSFNSEEPLDMRMDKAQDLKAEDIVNVYPEKKLEKILMEYGEEWLSRKIARAIKTYREKKKITTCRELAEIVLAVYGGRGRQHPATKTFQALRIAVNDEINEIYRGLEASEDLLKKGGRLCVISYHSLEDRAAKNFIREAGKKGLVKILTKKPLIPAYEEIKSNPSARSAKLRGAERL